MVQDTPSRKLDQYIVRMPDGMRDRIKAAADKNNRSMNAEIVATLEEKYPPQGLDIDLLAQFLESLAGISAPDGDSSYLEMINDALGSADQPWTVKAGWDGAVTFYPYSSAKTDDK
ncbi:Arc family DNA-binding protein [Brucella sp. HL-2]|nr:Arc family DNA-binding protein [Brucella sp. HL-2]MCV9909935.1 Arc family DNA-binding protein [Brucella sp. HL-2]